MKTTERTASPALGNAVGYFVVLWAVVNVEWINAEHQAEAVAMAGALFTYFFNEVRAVAGWIADRFKRPK